MSQHYIKLSYVVGLFGKIWIMNIFFTSTRVVEFGLKFDYTIKLF